MVNQHVRLEINRGFLDQADGKAWQRLGKLPSCVNMAEAGKYLSNSSMIIPAYTN